MIHSDSLGQVINKFKAGEYNVLVATSVGEEGLDIGEIDLIICYDAQKTPIRMVRFGCHFYKDNGPQSLDPQLQRVGRTGRKREGYVHVLLSEGREEFNLDKAKATYKDVQRTILNGDQLELYGDVERLLPEHVKPECLERVMEIVEYVREDGRRKPPTSNGARSPSKKRKRNDDVGRNIPVGASTGFVSVAELLVKGSKPRKKMTAKDFERAGQDDDTDMDLEAGTILVPPRRTVSTPASAKAHRKANVLRKASTMRTKKAAATKETLRKLQGELTSSQFSKKGVDDSDDMDIESTDMLSRPSAPVALSPSPSCHQLSRSCSPVLELPSATIELTSDDDDRRSPLTSPVCIVSSAALSVPSSQASIPVTPSQEPPVSKSVSDPKRHSPPSPSEASDSEERSIAWLVDEDDDPDFDIVNSSPNLANTRLLSATSVVQDNYVEDDGASASCSSPAESSKHLPSAEYDRLPTSREPCPSTPRVDDSVECISFNSAPKSQNPSPVSSPAWNLSSSPAPKDQCNTDVLAHTGTEYPDPLQDLPESSFPVRPKRKQRKKLSNILPEPESSPLMMPPPARQRVRRRRIDSSPEAAPKVKRRLCTTTIASHLLDTEAIHSGDDISAGSSHSDDDVENEFDRGFLQDSPVTQVSPSYNQTLVYRQSLLTQAPSNGKAPIFASRPVRRGLFAGGGNSTLRHRPYVFSPRSDDIPDEYAIGSFVVDDDAEIT